MPGPFVVPEHKLVVCTVHKSASTAFMTLLRRASGMTYTNAQTTVNPHYPPDGRFPTSLRSLSPREQRDILGDPSWKKYVAMRDPFVRLYSAWSQKIHQALDTPSQLQAYAADLGVHVDQLPSVSFESFVRRITAKLPNVNDHFSEQVDECDLRTLMPFYTVLDITRDDDALGALNYMVADLYADAGAARAEVYS